MDKIYLEGTASVNVETHLVGGGCGIICLGALCAAGLVC